MKRNLVILFLLAATLVQAQKLKKEDRQLLSDLQRHVQVLAHDSLQGRRTGTEGEQKAIAYISRQFSEIGLTPKGTNGFLQTFTVDEGKQIGAGTYFNVAGRELALGKEYFPLVYTANINMEALPSMVLQEPEMPWFWDLKETLQDAASNPHFDIHTAIKEKVKEIKAKGATALFIYNTSDTKDGIAFNGRDRSEAVAIPVVYLTKEAVQKYFSDEYATLDIKLKTDVQPKKRSGSNVVGFIDNGANTTVILGAHFDHLGKGEDGNSLVRTANEIHNGADDNASGTAALIELARLLKGSKLKASNYLFIAFSGEELGLYGSKFFTENPTVDLSKVSYMINMDMLGRLNNTVTVGGYGTSPAWGTIYAVKGKKALYAGPLQYKFDSSGTGPSDHVSFYRKNIPVLFFFTGLHSDYHRPTDDADKINYTGQMHIVKHIYSLIEAMESNGQKLTFTPTRETQSTTSARFSVTMGIMPDYTFSGSGVKVDGISDGKAAQKAGLMAGDVITKLGAFAINSMESYMQALSSFKAGEATTVEYTRGAEKKKASIVF
jgi:aminopeptidase YwaD